MTTVWRLSLILLAAVACTHDTPQDPAPVAATPPAPIAAADGGAAAAPTPAAASGNDCVPMLDDGSVSIGVHGSGPTGWSGYDAKVDLAAHTVTGTLADDKEKQIHTRTMEPGELAALSSAFRVLCLKSEVAGDYAVGGGCAHYEIRERDGSVRLLGYKDCAPRGATYYAVPTAAARRLADIFPRPDKQRAPAAPASP